MIDSPAFLARWKWCALSCTAIVLLALMPQLHFWLKRGSQWQGSYVALQGDEFLYSAYVNALIDGRPRRTDPAMGEDDIAQKPLPESLFSVQFIPAFMIAWIAKAFGMSAAGAFIALLGVSGLLASLSLIWLLVSVTNDKPLAAVGVLVILCFGVLAGGQGLIGLLLKPDVRFLGFPFLRRYEPSLPFPLFFVFCALVWHALTSGTKKSATTRATLAGISLAVLIFSYFYLWTAAIAWLVCIAFLWLVVRPADRRLVTRVMIVTSLPVVAALSFYVYLLSHLPTEISKAQVLTFTHQPDLLRVPEMIGAFSFVLLLIGVLRGRVSLNDPKVIIAASFALVPFLVLNQQVITGRSIQPFHYEVLITNYVVLVALVLIVRLLQPVVARRTVFLLVTLCLLWGSIEVNLSAPIRSTYDLATDEMVPVLRRLKELAKTDGTWERLRTTGKSSALVFSPLFSVSGRLPTWAPQGLLLAAGSASFQSVPQAHRKEWLYMHFYYCGTNEEELRELLNDRTDDHFLAYYTKSNLFGPERALLFLGLNSQPIRQDEIESEIREYGAFVDSFSREQALKRPITYAVTLAKSNFDFTNLDRWYERDAGETVGVYTLYRLKLRE